MNPPSHRERPTRVIVVLEGILPSEKSAADIADAINALSAAFSVTIVTSDPVQCERIFPGAMIVPLPRVPVRGAAFAFYMECWFLLPCLRGDLIYVAGVEHVPSVAMTFRRPVLCYGNSHPMQHALNTSRKQGLLSGILAHVNRAGMSAGLRRCDLILAISPQLREVYRSLGIPSSKLRELPLGVPLDLFRPKKKDPARPGNHLWMGVYHGTLSKDRGLDIMIEGAKMLSLRRRDFRIKLVGCAPEDEKAIKRQAESAGVEEFFEILPPVPHDEIPAILWSADFGISLLEPNAYFAASPPVKVLEFLAAGLPVIANTISTHSLYLKEGTNAVLIPYDASSFADAMNVIIENSELREKLAANALQSAAKFSNELAHQVLKESVLELVG